MTFKAEWEKAHTKHSLSDDLIRQMLSAYYNKSDIDNFTIIEGGCANINVLVSLKANEANPFAVLRIYLRDPTTAIKEKNIFGVLGTKLPVPEIYYIGELQGYTFALTGHFQGISLRDYLLRPGKKNVSKIMYDVGQALRKISKISFDQAGFFDSNLKVTEPITRNKILLFFEECLRNEKINLVLTKSHLKEIGQMFLRHASLLPDQDEKSLVHADFDPSNILVNKRDESIKISGILDWEFSFSGSTLCDVASMLRYAHRMPMEYRDSFLEGLTSYGYTLPPSWEITINLLNILSLLDCLKRANLDQSPAQVKDIKELLIRLTNNEFR